MNPAAPASKTLIFKNGSIEKRGTQLKIEAINEKLRTGSRK